MRVLVTRGQPEADELARTLAGLGHEAVVEPLLETRVMPGDPTALVGDLSGVQALLFTSANGARAFAALNGTRHLPVFTVGQSTAAAARAASFGRVESADGNVEDLAALVRRRLDPAGGALFHAAARQVAGDLKGTLESAGFTLRRAVLYEAVAAAQLSRPTVEALSAGQVDAVMFFSPRTGETFVRLVQAQALLSSLVRCHALCPSAAVAAKVDALDWAGVLVAERPTQEALLASLKQLASSSDAAGREKGHDGKAMDGKNGSDRAASNGATGSNGSVQAPALAIISAFGGIRPMASKLGIAVSTVQGWRERGVIPAGRHDEVRRVARENGIALDEDLLAASATPPKVEAPARPVTTSKPVSSSATAATAASASAAATPPAETKPQPAASTQSKASETTAQRDRPPPKSPTAPPPQPQGFGASRMGLIVGVGVAAIALILIGSFVIRPGGDEELETRISALAERVAAQETQLQAQGAAEAALTDLDSRIAALEQRPASDEATTAVIADLQARLESLEQAGPEAGSRASAALQALSGRVDSLEADAAIAAGGTTALEKRLVELDQRVTALEETIATQGADVIALGEAFAASGVGDSVSDASLALALGQLRDALRTSGPYETELALVRSLVAPDDELSAQLDLLTTHAAGGVPSLTQLKARYPVFARRAAAVGVGEEAEGLLSGVLRRVSEVVTIRPVGDVEGSGVGAHLARAEAGLAADDLDGALTEVEALPPAALAAMEGWLVEARARLAADKAVAALGARAVAKLGGADG